MLNHADVCEKLFGADKHGYIAAMRSAEYADLIQRFEIDNNKRAAAFLATAAHETGGFKILRESGNYTSAARICEVFGVGRHTAAITEREAARLVRKPYDLFERVYGLGNPLKAQELGNVRDGDGFLFRGLGMQQITGRTDHEKYAQMIGCRVDELITPINSIHAAMLEWRDKHCNFPADRADLRTVRHLINGGLNGYEDFKAKYHLIVTALDGTAETISVVKLGSVGADVEEMQRALQARGFYKSAEIDGSFGALTQRSLVAYQFANDLPVHGVLDAQTRQSLQSSPINPTLPGRKAVEPINYLDRAKLLWRSVLAALGLTEAANQAGLQPVEAFLSVSNRVQDLSHKISMQPRFFGYAAIAIVAFGIVKWVRSAVNAD